MRNIGTNDNHSTAGAWMPATTTIEPSTAAIE